MTGTIAGFYRGRPVLVTGGLGFIGSNLARRLVDLGADVLVFDALVPDQGGNVFNLEGVADRLRIEIADTRQQAAIDRAVRNRSIVFNLAGQISHIDSMRDPQADLDINCRGAITLLEACRRHNPTAKIVYASTRQIYGRAAALPVDESHVVRPTDVNGINKAAGEAYHLVYNDAYGMRACSLRLTNVYGPRQLIRHSRQGFAGWFIRLALENRPIQLYGDGSQLRDLLHVDDAVEAFLLAGAEDRCNGRARNAGGGRVEYVEWPAEKKAIDIGSFYTDSRRFEAITGWRRSLPLADGLRATLAFYRQHWHEYAGEARDGAQSA